LQLAENRKGLKLSVTALASVDAHTICGSTLYSCTVTGNRGAGNLSALYNCTVVGNEGGLWGVGVAQNCIIYGNINGNYSTDTILNHCLTTPLPTNGIGNIDADPKFMDAAVGDFRLRPDSPCIDAGTNLLGMPVSAWGEFDAGGYNDYGWVVVGTITDATDILGNTRFIDGNGDGKVAWDIGAYEFNSYPPPRLSSPPRLTSDGWKLNLTGAHNKWVHVQRSSNLRFWEEIWYDWMGSAGEKQVIDADTGQRAMFYRAFVEQ